MGVMSQLDLTQQLRILTQDPEDTEYDTSDDEPLAKYKAKTEEGNDKSDGDVCRGRGRPRGKAKPKK